jgi:LmbE family N-acetylglucosaminyl deacetylase
MRRPVIFLSPHFDDVVLSCGGTVARLADAGYNPLMVTIFGGEIVDELLTDFARWKHHRWGILSTDGVRAARQAEDKAAAAILGCHTRWLGFPDAIYRGERYTADSNLFGTPAQVDQALSDLIVAEVCSLPEWRVGAIVFVPLAIGGHVDHQLTYAAGQQLAAMGATVWAYEDCPYAMHTPEGVQRRLAIVGDEVGALHIAPIGNAAEKRVAAILAYHSQVPVIFRFSNDVGTTVRDHMRRAGGGTPAEHFWPLQATFRVSDSHYEQGVLLWSC